MIEDKIGCKARELKNNWKTLMDPDAVKISGHIKKVTEIHDNVIVFVETCECCGEVSLTWAKPGPLAENLKRLSGFPYDKDLAETFDSMRAGK